MAHGHEFQQPENYDAGSGPVGWGCRIQHLDVTGPVSYPTGGIVIDASAYLSEVHSIAFTMSTPPIVGGVLTTLTYALRKNIPTPGKVTLLIYMMVVGFDTVEVLAGTNLSALMWDLTLIGLPKVRLNPQ